MLLQKLLTAITVIDDNSLVLIIISDTVQQRTQRYINSWKVKEARALNQVLYFKFQGVIAGTHWAGFFFFIPESAFYNKLKASSFL